MTIVVRIMAAIGVLAGSVAFLAAFPACQESVVCTRLVGIVAFSGICLFMMVKRPLLFEPRRFRGELRPSPPAIVDLDRKISTLKTMKRKEQSGLCALCHTALPKVGAVLDCWKPMDGYRSENTRLLCRSCDVAVQTERLMTGEEKIH